MSDPRFDVIAQHLFTRALAETPGQGRRLRLIELPAGLSANGEVTVAALVARNSESDTGFQMWQAKNYDAHDPAPVATYQLLASHDRFARHGQVVADYPATTNTLDLTAGILVQLDGVDFTLNDQTSFDAVADALLVFIGSEILSVASVTLVAPGLYRLFVARNRFASPRQPHAAGAEVFIVEREGLLQLNHPAFQPFNTAAFKVALQNAAGATELGDLDAVELALTGRLFAEPKLANLFVNENSSCPSYSSGEDILIDWTLTLAFGAYLLPDRYTVRTRIDLVAGSALDLPTTNAALEAETLVGTQRVAGSTLTISNADLITALGSETDFVAIARREVEGPDFRILSEPIALQVIKI